MWRYLFCFLLRIVMLQSFRCFFSRERSSRYSRVSPQTIFLYSCEASSISSFYSAFFLLNRYNLLNNDILRLVWKYLSTSCSYRVSEHYIFLSAFSPTYILHDSYWFNSCTFSLCASDFQCTNKLFTLFLSHLSM